MMRAFGCGRDRLCSLLEQGWHASVDDVLTAIKEEAGSERVEELLSKAPPNLVDYTFGDETLLIMAARTSRVDVARLLLSRGCKHQVGDSVNAKTALLEAVLAGHVSRTSDCLSSSSTQSVCAGCSV